MYLFFSPQTFTSLMVRARGNLPSRENRDEGGKGDVSVLWRYMDQAVFGSREKEIKNDLQRSLGEDLTKTNLSEKINKPLDNWQTVGKGSKLNQHSQMLSHQTQSRIIHLIQKLEWSGKARDWEGDFLLLLKPRKRLSQQQDPVHSSLAATLTELRSRNREKKPHPEHNQSFLYSWCVFMSPAFPAQLLLAVKL